MAKDEKTEKATPKRVKESRKKGQVAKSTDLNGALVLGGGLSALSSFGPAVVSGAAATRWFAQCLVPPTRAPCARDV